MSSSNEITRAHRADLRTLTNLADRDLTILWQRISTATDPERVRDNLARVLPQLVSIYGAAAATLAANYYDDMRDEERLRSRFTAVTTALPDAGRTEALAGWAVGPLFAAEPDHAAALTLASGGLQRIVSDASRSTITESAIADPHHVIWARIVSGGACEYCSDREDTDDTSAHDHCNCGVEPRWS